MAALRRQNSVPLKQGFLVKKTRSWKSRWCTLLEDRLCYYGKTSRDEPYGCLPLYGASLVSPVPEYKNHKRKGVFKVVSEDGKEYLLQAPTEEEREVWIHAVSGVIRALVSAPRTRGDNIRDSRRLSCQVNLSDVLGAMQDPDAGIQRSDGHDHSESSHFTGRHGVDWTLKWSFASSRQKGAVLLGELMSMGHVQMMRVPGKKKTDVVPDLDTQTFHDSDDVHYKFTAVTKSPSIYDVFPESSASSGSSTEGEASEGDFLEEKSPKKGKVTMEGFLMKRGYYRRKWKLRKVILREGPPAIEYYSASKGAEKHLLKYVALEGVAVVDIDDKKKDKAKETGDSKKKNLFCLQKDQAKMAMVFQAEDSFRKSEWLAALRRICPESPGCVPYSDP